MDDGLKLLREIGAQTIHNETHISREYVQAIIHESFDGLSSVQFIGFVSILEREYNVDLSELKSKGRAHFNEEENKSEEPKKIFMIPKTEKSNTSKYIFLVLGVILGLLYYIFVYQSSVSPDVESLDNTTIEHAQETIEEVVVQETVVVEDSKEMNTTKETVVAKSVEVAVQEVEEPAAEPEVVEVVRTLKILPKNKLWAGYINIATNQKYQKIFRKEFVLDTTKNWLLLFGSGTVKLEVNGKVDKYSSGQNMRFKYVDGVFTKITVTEFKSLNKGRKW